MKDLVVKSKQLKTDASELLGKGKVVETLEPFGKVVLKGSYALDLMTVEDIDMSVINPNADYKESALEALNKFAKRNYFQSYHLFDWVKYNKPEFPKGFYLGLQTPFKGTKWKIDIWFLKGDTDYEKNIVPKIKNLPPGKKYLILQLKNHRKENKLEIGSADIYKLVLEGKIKTIADLKRFSKSS